MEQWQQKQAKFDQLPVDVETINRAISNLNQIAATLNSNVTSVEADINVLVMLVSRIEQCVQQQTKAIEKMTAERE